jgi:hypothetical protein
MDYAGQFGESMDSAKMFNVLYLDLLIKQKIETQNNTLVPHWPLRATTLLEDQN